MANFASQMTQELPPSLATQLAEYRAQIDALDDKLIALLKERIGIVQEVGKLKHQHQPGKYPLRPGREAQQLRRVITEFTDSTFLPEAAAAIWRIIISASLHVEGELKIIAYTTEEYEDLFWIAREYFGSFSHVQREPGVKRIIGALIDNKANVGVLPMLRSDEVTPWWPDLAQGGESGPKIFAHIPSYSYNRTGPNTLSALAIGFVEPEESGNDISLFAFDTEDNTSMHKLQSAFSTAKLEANWVDVLTHNDGRRQHLVEIKGFVTPADSRMQQFMNQLGSAILHSAYIGAYAPPVILKNK